MYDRLLKLLFEAERREALETQKTNVRKVLSTLPAAKRNPNVGYGPHALTSSVHKAATAKARIEGKPAIQPKASNPPRAGQGYTPPRRGK